MINASDIRAITIASRHKNIIQNIEESVKESAYQGKSYCEINVELPREELLRVAEYFKNSGFYFDYNLLKTNRLTGVTIYYVILRW